MPEIRPVRSSDRVQWDALWTGYLRFYRQHVSIEVTDGTFARLVDERVQPYGLVAERDGSLVGFVHYVFHRPPGRCRTTAISKTYSSLRQHAEAESVVP